MRSPFAIFRKYQKIAMVIVLVLIMVAFTLGDALMQTDGQLPPTVMALICALVGASLAAFVGIQAGKPYHYSIGGAIIGAALGFFLVPGGEGNIRVTTAMGDKLTFSDINQRMKNRNDANRIVQAAFEKGFAYPEENPFLARMWNQSVQRFMFGQASEQSIVTSFVMQIEADRMGVTFSDDAVNHYLNQVSNNKMTKGDFHKLCNNLRLSELEAFDLLRDELKARHAMMALIPPTLETPEEYWEIYRRLNVQQRLDLAAVPVSAFATAIEDPSDEDVQKFFNENKSFFPGQRGPTEPGLRQPRKIRVGYFKVDYKQAEAQVGEISKEDIETYYKENKERFRENPFPSSQSAAPKTGPIEAPLPGSDEPASSTNGEKPAETPESNPAENKKETPKTETKAEPKPETKPEQPKAEEKPEPKESDAKPEAEKPEVKEESSFLTKPTGDLLALADTSSIVLAQADDPKEAEAKETDKKDKSDEKKDESDPKPAADAPEDNLDDLLGPPTGDAGKPNTDGEPKLDLPEPKYRELDDELREEIRNLIKSDRAFEQMQAIAKEAREVMFQIKNQYLETIIAGLEPPKVDKYTAKMKAYAEGKPLEYVVTDPLSYPELTDPEKYPVGSAIDPMNAQNSMAASDQLFSSDAAKLYTPLIGEDFNAKDHYVYWKVEDQPDHIPELDEPGVREQTIEAWKTQQAIPKAKERAEELAKQAQESKKPFAEAFGDIKVSDAEGAETITTQLTVPFSWMQTSSAPSPNPFAQQNSLPRISPITGVEKAGMEFMETVFEKMENGEIGVVPNADQSVFYVVQVTDREPGTPEDQAALRNSFLKENLFDANPMFGQQTPYQAIFNTRRNQIIQQWQQATMVKYDVQYYNDPKDEAL